MTGPRFVAKERSEFAGVLRKRVRQYLKDNDIAAHDNGAVAIKGVILIASYLLPFIVLLVWQPTNAWQWIGLAVLQGLGAAGVGMSVMHDSLHGSLSPKQMHNTIWGWSMNILGGSVVAWQIQHNRQHHTYTNILGHDEDIRERSFLRMSASAPLLPIHRYQHYYALFLYPLMTLNMLFKDFTALKDYDKAGFLTDAKTTYKVEMIKVIVTKFFYGFAFLVLPVALGVLNIWQTLAYFLIMHAVVGFVLSVVFQLAHVVEVATHPEANADFQIENEWVIHQLETTVNFCPKNPVLNWYTGGLNYQVEHHLFPNLCHIHYPSIAPIVRQTAEEFGIADHQEDSFWKILGSHMRLLKTLGRTPPQSASVEHREPVLAM